MKEIKQDIYEIHRTYETIEDPDNKNTPKTIYKIGNNYYYTTELIAGVMYKELYTKSKQLIKEMYGIDLSMIDDMQKRYNTFH
jgi:hypothetical protein